VRPPDKAAVAVEGKARLNLFLYQTTLNAAWRNAEVPQQLRPGEVGPPPLALDLHYLVTAYGIDEADPEVNSHRLLGPAIGTLHDHPLLGAREIEAQLGESELQDQVERVRITPQPLSLDEMSKLWTAFQAQYRISAAYQASVVLIDSTRARTTPLPVLTRGP